MTNLLKDWVNDAQLSAGTKLLLTTGINILDIIIILLIGIIVNFILKKLIKRIFNRPNMANEQRMKTLALLSLSISKYAVFFLVAFQVLVFFGIDPTSILAVASIGSVAIGFGAQGLVQDFITGVSILADDSFRVGDYISLQDKTGYVEAIGLRNVRLRGTGGNLHIFPNRDIKSLTNMSKGNNTAVVDLIVSYESEIDKLILLLEDEMSHAKETIAELTSQPAVLGISEFNIFGLNVRIIAHCGIEEKESVERALRKLVKIRLEKEGITKP